MELKNIFKIAPLLLILIGAALFSMNPKPSQSVPMITIETSDGQEVNIPENIALKSSVIKDLLDNMIDIINYQLKSGAIVDLPLETSIPLPTITKAELDPIIEILKEINSADQSRIKRTDGKYIAQRIQPMIDQTLSSIKEPQIGGIIRAAEYLDLEYIVNGAIRVLTQKVLNQNRAATLDKIMAYVYSQRGRIKKPQYREGLLALLKPLFEKQYMLLTAGRNGKPIKELSVADYIAIEHIPTIKNGILNLIEERITSLEGLSLIEKITGQKVLRLSINGNFLSWLPHDAFDGLPNLVELYLSDNHITALPPTILSRLVNLKKLSLSYNQLTELPVTLFEKNGKLIELDLESNALKTLPGGIFNNLTNLEILMLEKNKFDYTEEPLELPFPLDIFIPLVNLYKLEVLDNPFLKKLDERSFRLRYHISENVRIR